MLNSILLAYLPILLSRLHAVLRGSILIGMFRAKAYERIDNYKFRRRWFINLKAVSNIFIVAIESKGIMRL